MSTLDKLQRVRLNCPGEDCDGQRGHLLTTTLTGDVIVKLFTGERVAVRPFNIERL